MDYSHFSCNVICRCAVFKRAEKVYRPGMALFVVCTVSSVTSIFCLVFVPTAFKRKCSSALLLSTSLHTRSKVLRAIFFLIKCLILILGEKKNLPELFK